MKAASEEIITRLLEETLDAHSVYETSVLGGVFDEDWSSWYATYLVEHGLPDLLPNGDTVDANRLGAMLTQLDVDYRRTQPESDWPAYYARRLSAAVE